MRRSLYVERVAKVPRFFHPHPKNYMDTLTNVDNRRSGNLTPSARLISCTIPSETNNGASVENAPIDLAAWYVLRVSYSREQKVYDWLRNQGFEVYIPLHYEEVLSDGKRKRVKVPLLHNLIFYLFNAHRH